MIERGSCRVEERRRERERYGSAWPTKCLAEALVHIDLRWYPCLIPHIFLNNPPTSTVTRISRGNVLWKLSLILSLCNKCQHTCRTVVGCVRPFVKAALIIVFILTAGRRFSGCNLKGVTRGDERADNYHPTPTQSSVWVESHRFHQLCFQTQQAATETFPPCKITRSAAEIDRTPCMHALNVMSEINVTLCAQLKTTSLVSLCQTTLSFVHFFFFFFTSNKRTGWILSLVSCKNRSASCFLLDVFLTDCLNQLRW